MSVRRRMHRVKKSFFLYWQLYVLVLPAMIYLLIFNYIPIYGIQIAFKKFSSAKGIWASEWSGIGYFIQFIQFPKFWAIVKNTLRITLYSLATFPLPILLALLINELKSPRFGRVVQMVTYAPHFLSTVVLVSIVTLFLDRSNGIINHMLAALGVARKSFLADPSAFPAIYVWSGVWQNIGWDSIIYISALSGVSPEIVEAAKIDGAGRVQVIAHVYLPTIMPTIMILLILCFGNIMSLGFEKVYLLQNSLNLDASEVISTYVYSIGLMGGQLSYSTAINLFNTVVNVALLMAVNAIVRRFSEISVF